MNEEDSEGQIRPATVLEVKPGEIVFDAERKAAKIAFLDGTDVTFTHNENAQTVTLEQARELLTPDNLRKTIEGLKEEQTNLQQRLERQMARVKLSLDDEMDFAKKAYPSEFPQEETTKQP